MIRQSHHLIAHVLQLTAGGFLGLASAGLANRFGFRSAERLPGESRFPHCYFCLVPLNWQNAFPLFGWLLRPDALDFPCACGRRKKAWQQPSVEIAGLIFGIAAVFFAGWPGMSIPLALGLGLLPAIAIIDLHFGVIPDELNLALGILGLFAIWFGTSDFYIACIVSSVLLAIGLFCALIYSRLRGKEMLGLGDVKFFAAAGLWLHPEMVPWFLGMSSFFGIAIGLGWKKLTAEEEFPFGPALCLSLALCVLYQLIKM